MQLDEDRPVGTDDVRGGQDEGVVVDRSDHRAAPCEVPRRMMTVGRNVPSLPALTGSELRFPALAADFGAVAGDADPQLPARRRAKGRAGGVLGV